MKKNKQNPRPQEEELTGLNFANPFADLKVELPPPPEPPKPAPPPPPTKEELQFAELSHADQALLKEFQKGGALPAAIGNEHHDEIISTAGRLTFVIQRKGHKGKTVTLVHGFKETSTEERMLLCSELKTALGVGARFLDACLEIQGDQRERAAKWFEARHFHCNIP